MGDGRHTRPDRGVCGLLQVVVALGIIREGTITDIRVLESGRDIGLEAVCRPGFGLHRCAQQ